MLTGSCTVMGTAAYMAPEQREGQGDHRADIYALGVLSMENAAGNAEECSTAFGESPACRMCALDTVVLGTAEPGRRYQQAGDMGTDMKEIRTTPSQGLRQLSQEGRTDNAWFSRPLVWAALVISPVTGWRVPHWKVVRSGNLAGDPWRRRQTSLHPTVQDEVRAHAWDEGVVLHC